MGFLDGLKKFALGALDLEEEELFEEPKKKVEPKKQEPPKPVSTIDESTLVYDRKYTCPICEAPFVAKTLKSGKVRMSRQDVDLRPVYKEIDPIKYDIVSCPECGYSVLAKHFGNLTKFQTDAVRGKINENYKRKEYKDPIYSYEEARIRYELAIATAMVKKSKFSEKAYLCLKMAWLIRGETEHLDPESPEYEEKKKSNQEEEKEFLKKALDGFELARMKEAQIEGMDEATLDYLMAALGLEIGNYDLSVKLLGNIIGSRTANSRIKDKARDLKDVVLQKAKEEKEKS